MRTQDAAELARYGVLPSQVVDLARDDDPRILRYLDLRDASPPPLVIEADGEPRLHVLRGSGTDPRELVDRWSVRATVRGDGAWIGVLEPGRLRVYRPQVKAAKIRVTEFGQDLGSDQLIPRLLYDVATDTADFSIRAYLVRLLGSSIQEAVDLHRLSPDDALSLVGRGLFWRFLIDRNLLAAIDPADVCPGARAWEQCLDSKAFALQTFRWLDDTFNGGMLPFDVPPHEYPPEVFEWVLGNIAHGATDSGQLRLPSDWSEINFAHVPVGLLSQIYEAFSHTQRPDRAKQTSIHYTPRHIAEFVVREALDELPDEIERPRVLDPAVGAGVFLVTAFRQLAEREWRRTGVRPRREALRRILRAQLHGFDIDPQALRLAELALYLSALELDPNPRPPKALRFEALRGRTLRALPPPAGSLGPVSRSFAASFDLVVGNPPWTAGSEPTNAKATWVEHSRATVAKRLGQQHADSFDFPDANPDLPFVWRAMEWAKPGGRIAFVLHARWLFGQSPKAERARRDVLEAVHVTGILNGSDLRKTTVWPNTDVPFCILFGINEVPPADAAFTFVSPRLETAKEKQQSRMRIDWTDARPTSVREAVETPWLLKARFRGDRVAERALQRIFAAGRPLHELLDELGVEFKNGYQLGGSARKHKQVSGADLHGLPDLRQTQWRGLEFAIDARALPIFDLPKLLHPRPRELYRAPLLLLRKAIPASAAVARTHRADADLAYHESFQGLSFAGLGRRGKSIRDYLQIILQSSIYLFVLILTDPQYGVWVDAAYLDSVERLPVVPFEALSPSLRRRLRKLSSELVGPPTTALSEAIDRFAFDVFNLSEVDADAVRDTVATALPSAEVKQRALRQIRDAERAEFVATASASLERVFSASSRKVDLRLRPDLDLTPWRFIEVRVGPISGRLEARVPLPLPEFLEFADTEGASQVIVLPEPGVALVGLLDRYALWTKTRARLLANDLIEVFGDDQAATQA